MPKVLLQKLDLQNVLDDRMFTLSWYGNHELVEHLKGNQPDQEYKHHAWWSQYVNIDRDGSSIQNREMHERLMTAATNARWANYGTFYGVTQYSFVALTAEGSAYFFNKVLATHAMTMYYKLALLALVQRTCLLRFSKEVTAISQLPQADRNIAARISSLYKQYIRFINKVYFREVSAQEQGIELYDLLHSQMWLDEQVKDLDREIQELHQYVMILEEDRRNNKLDILTYIGAFFVVPSFIGTYFGVSDYQMKEHWWELSLFSILASLLVFAAVRSNDQWRWLWLLLTGVLMVVLLFIYPAFRFQ
jgi:NADH:ubiquinone oxidoreductase subunit 6 (subunit J)